MRRSMTGMEVKILDRLLIIIFALALTFTVCSANDAAGTIDQKDIAANATATNIAIKEEIRSSEDAVSSEYIEKSLDRTISSPFPIRKLEADFSDRDVQKLTLNTNVDVRDVKMTVQRLNRRPDNVPEPVDLRKGRVSGYHNIYISGLDRNMIQDASIKFRVTRTWIRENGLNGDTIRLMKYHGSQWVTLKTRILGKDDQYIYCEATATGFSIFAIVADTMGEETSTTGPTATPAITSTSTPIHSRPAQTSVSPPAQPGFGVFLSLSALVVVRYLKRK